MAAQPQKGWHQGQYQTLPNPAQSTSTPNPSGGSGSGGGIVGHAPKTVPQIPAPPTPPSSRPAQPAPTIPNPTPTRAPQRAAHTYAPQADRQAVGYDPSMRTVRPEETIEGRLTGIMDSAHPIMQRARTRARQESQDRGLLNSTLGVQAAEGAVLDRAVPIAQYDAGVHERASADNQVATNRSREYFAAERNLAGRDNQAAFNRAMEYNAEARNLAAQGNMDAAVRVAMADLDARTRTNIARFDAETKQSLASMEQKHQRILQTQLTAKDVFNTLANNIAHINANVQDADTRMSIIENAERRVEQYYNMLEDTTALEGTEISKFFAQIVDDEEGTA